MMLDMKRTWDELIERRAPPDKREKILNNRFYQSLSIGARRLARSTWRWRSCGSCAPSATTRSSSSTRRPPRTRSTSSTRPTASSTSSTTTRRSGCSRPALAAGKFGLRLFNLGGSYVAKTIARFTGTETLQQLADFMLNISGMNEGFRERAHQTRALLEAESTGLVLVTGPMPERLDEAIYFHTLLLQNKMNIAAIVVNRVHRAGLCGRCGHRPARLPDDLRRKIEETLEEAEHLATQDARGIERLREACAPTPLVLVPRFDLDVHDLRSLWETSRYLWGDAAMKRRRPPRVNLWEPSA